MISHLRYGRNWECLQIGRSEAPIFAWEWPSRRLRRKYNIKKTAVQINVRAPKALPMMGPIGSFDSDFPCTKTVANPLASVAPVVRLDEEDSGEYDEEGDNTRELGVVDVVVVVELRIEVVRNDEVVRDDEGSLGRVPSLIVK
jgi:hypothetical protein